MLKTLLFAVFLFLSFSLITTTESAPGSDPAFEKIPFSAELLPAKKTKNFWIYQEKKARFIPTSTLASLFKARLHYYNQTSTVVLRLKQQKALEAANNKKTVFLGETPVSLSTPIKKLPDSNDLLIPWEIFEKREFREFFGVEIEFDSDSLIRIISILEIEPPEIESQENLLRVKFLLPTDLKNYEITLFPEERPAEATLVIRFPYARALSLQTQRPKKSSPPDFTGVGEPSLYTQEQDTQERALNFKFPLPANTNLSDINAYQKTWPKRALVIEIAGWPAPQPPPPKESAQAAQPSGSVLRLITPKPKEAPKVQPPIPPSPKAAPLPTKTIIAPKPRPLIMIDPGHGGKDAGTTSPRGFKEKELTLSMSQEIKKAFEEKLPQSTVVFTRNRDVFLNPETRATLVRKKNPDLLISIHANSARAKNRGGFEVYIPSEIALDPEALELVIRENQSDFAGTPKITKRKIERLIVKKSERLATGITQTLHKNLGPKIRNRGVRRGDFLILRETGLSAVLIETGFLSNPEDERLLRDPAFQKTFAEAIAEGTIKYLKEPASSKKVSQQTGLPKQKKATQASSNDK